MNTNYIELHENMYHRSNGINAVRICPTSFNNVMKNVVLDFPKACIHQPLKLP